MPFALRREHHRSRGSVILVLATIAVTLLVVGLIIAFAQSCAPMPNNMTGG